jgi:hypothetical protein
MPACSVLPSKRLEPLEQDNLLTATDYAALHAVIDAIQEKIRVGGGVSKAMVQIKRLKDVLGDF